MEENNELAKWLAGEMTSAELKAFENTPEYETYAKIAKYSAQLEAPAFHQEQLYNKVIDTKKVIPLHQRFWFKIAAVLVLCLGLSLFYKTNIAISEYAANGKQTAFSLPDDSKVVLNAGSEIDYKKWGWANHRKLQLQGEAYFRVAKGKKFEVNTDLGKVTVLGTQFNVKARNHRFDVTCYEGRVKVNYQDHEVIITKGKSVAFENGQAIEIPDHSYTQPQWTQGELTFVKEHLESIIKEIERHFDVTIEYNATQNTQLFTGTIPNDNIDQTLTIIAATYHLQVQKVNSDKIILKALDVEK